MTVLEAIEDLREHMDARFDVVERRIDTIEDRLASIEDRLASIEDRISVLHVRWFGGSK